ncbi:MAG: precorrin-6Y C(5,15)-methyltransferase [Pseudomonadota bacterium]|jgi:precorrin-6B C5,15-methyltransferase / cobalt-precorrin-6B C5,C15-methyltransferase
MSFERSRTPAPPAALDPSSSATRTRKPWLTLVGIGADGEAGLSVRAREAISGAELVFGSARQLALVPSLLNAETAYWPTRFALGVARVVARRGLPTCVLASGDPFFYGVGATLSPHLEEGEFLCYPLPSSVSLAAARLGWSVQDTEVVSLHGRELRTIVPHLHPGRRIFALSWNLDTPAELARLLIARGFGPSRMTVLEALGGPEERIRSCQASDFALSRGSDLNLVAIDLVADPHAVWLPLRASVADTEFEHDGQLTKQDVRAITLSALQPRPGARLWDVGAGAGSIGIEWLLSHPSCEAIAIERDAARCERIKRNAEALGVPQLTVVEGQAPEALAGLAPPDTIFVGGGVTHPELVERCWNALGSRGRLVINAVALESEAQLLAEYAARGGELHRISLESAAPLGTMTAWRPSLPVTQWRIQKP